VVDGLGNKQKYSLFPNPNDGNLTLLQLQPDSKPVMAEIWNAAGVSVFRGQLNFANGKTQLQIDKAMPGLYMLQLVDNSGNRFTIKFVIEN